MKTTAFRTFSLALAVGTALGFSTSLMADNASYDPISAQAGGLSNTAISKSYNLKVKAPGQLNDRGIADLTAQPVLFRDGRIKEEVPNSEKGIIVGINASVLPPAGVSTTTALSWLSVSENTWTCLALSEEKTITVNLNIPTGVVAGDYVYTISANPEDTGLGWGGSGHALTVTVEEYIPEAPEQTFVLDTTAPSVNITQPLATSFTYVTGGTPVNVAFDAAEIESPITSLSASVGNNALSLTSTGLGTTSASATGTFTVASIGTYTVTAKAQNTRALPVPNPDNLPANLEGASHVDFSVNYDMTNCWLPPLSLGKVSKGGSTVPIKFIVRDANGLFVADSSVQVKVSEVISDQLLGNKDLLITTGTFGSGSSGVRIEQIDAYTGQYIVNFPTATGAHQYRADVFFNGIKQASKEFSVSAK